MLTKKQKQTLDYITKYIKENDYAPSLEEIKRHFRLSSVSTVHEHVEALREKGYLKKIENQPRSIEINNKKEKSDLVEIPLLGTIAAGVPMEAIQFPGMIKVPKSQLSKSGKHYALHVEGNSMIDEGIFDGDTVVIKKQSTAEDGETVVALINNDEVTLKKIYKEKNKFRLQPANPDLKPIFTKELIIQGKVISVIRSFRELKEKINISRTKTKPLLNIKNKSISKEIDLPLDNEPLILIGDVIEKLRLLPDDSINCIITSPPYWDQRDYNIKNQMGSEKTPEEYINKILEVTNHLRRVLKRDGSFFLNIGDKYINRNLAMIPEKLTIKMQENGWMLRNKIIWHKPNHMPSSIKNRFSNTWEPIFFFIRNDCKRKYYFDLDSVRIAHITNGDNGKKNNLPKYIDEKTYERYYSHLSPKNKEKINYNGKFKNQVKNLGASPGARQSVNNVFYSKQRKYEVDSYEICSYLKNWKKKIGISTKDVDKYFGYKDTAGHWFRTDESGRSLPSPEDWFKLKNLLKFDNKYYRIMTKTHYVLQSVEYHPKGKNPGDMWDINTDKLKEAHFAIFPEDLPRKIIAACCSEGGIVLDPFAGSGTTGKVAKELNRKSIMIDLNPEYKKMMKKRFSGITPHLF